MILFLKKHLISICFIIFLLVFGIYGICEKAQIENDKIEGMNYLLSACVERNNGDESLCGDNFNPYTINDVHTTFSTIFSVETVLSNSSFIIPILFIVIVISPIYLEFKTKNIKNILMRMNYREFIFKNLKKIFIGSLIIPLFLIFIFILCYTITGSFDLNKTLTYFPNVLTIDNNLRSNLIEYYLFYFINIYLVFIFIGNIGFFFIKKSYNFAVLLISSMITYVMIDFIFDIVISRLIFGVLLNIDLLDSMNIFNYWAYHDVISILFMFVYALVLAVGSSFINYYYYKDKEILFYEEQK